MKAKVKIYVAGPITPTGNQPHPGLEFMDNIRRGIRASVDLIKRGYAVFCPFLDYQYMLVLGDGETLEPKHFYESSLAYMEVSDGLLVLPGWHNSMGTMKEIDRATELGVPIFFNMQTMDYYFEDVFRAKDGVFSTKAVTVSENYCLGGPL